MDNKIKKFADLFIQEFNGHEYPTENIDFYIKT
jgi:hypothetical protein